jgi:hypothetical protein
MTISIDLLKTVLMVLGAKDLEAGGLSLLRARQLLSLLARLLWLVFRIRHQMGQ